MMLQFVNLGIIRSEKKNMNHYASTARHANSFLRFTMDNMNLRKHWKTWSHCIASHLNGFVPESSYASQRQCTEEEKVSSLPKVIRI